MLKLAKKILLVFVLLALTLFTARIYLQAGVPHTHDGENHLARFANYRAALREGQIPPRFAPYLENGYGYPVFNYNYPLANILSVPLTVLGFSYQTAFKLIVVVALTGGAYGLWLWLDRWQYSATSKCAAVLLWLSSPFLLSTIAFRGSIGELLVYGMLPLLLHSLVLLSRKPQTPLLQVLLWSAFLLAHNVSVLWLTPLLVGYFFIEWWLAGKSTEQLTQAAGIGLLAVACTLWFWLPALAELDAIVLSGAKNAHSYSKHFVSLHQLVSAPLEFGYSFPGFVDSLSFALGTILWITIVVFPLWVVTQRQGKLTKSSLVLLCLWGAACLLIVLQLRTTELVWNVFPVLRFIQFPWRLGLAIPVLTTPLFALLISQLSNKLRLIALLLTLSYWLHTTGVQPIAQLDKADAAYDSFPLSTTTQNENRPQGFTYIETGETARQPFIYKGTGEVILQNWQGSRRSYQVTLTSPSTIVEPTMYFPGWETQVNGAVVQYVDSQDIAGRIAYTLAPGNYQVETQFTQRTLPRRVGNSISLVTIIWLGISSSTARKKTILP